MTNKTPVAAVTEPVGESAAPAGGTQPLVSAGAPSARCRARGPRVLATVTDYAGLIGALRQRCDELNITFEQLDVVAGFTDNYSSKILSPSLRPIRRLGHMSTGAILGALGLKLAVIEDPAQLARVRDRYRPRKFARPRGWQARVPLKKVWTTPVIEDPSNPDG
jgi:hypothetical protein